MPGLPLRDASVPDRKLGYGPNSRLPVKIATRNSAVYRDPATILIDRKDVYFDGELETVESPMGAPQAYTQGFHARAQFTWDAVDDPDVYFYQNYMCSSVRNYPRLLRQGSRRDARSAIVGGNPAKRQKLVWEIDSKLQWDWARPVIYDLQAATCWQPRVKGPIMTTNSRYNSWRCGDIWLERYVGGDGNGGSECCDSG